MRSDHAPVNGPDQRPCGAEPDVPSRGPNGKTYGEMGVARLRSQTARGSAVTIIAQLFKQGLTLAGTAVIARYIWPEEQGLVTMIWAVTAFVIMFSEMGLTMATVQRPEITEDQISTLFWLNVGFGTGCAAVIAGSAPVLVWFYGEPRLLWLTMATAAGPVLVALGAQHQALLKRRMSFAKLAVADVSGVGGGYVVGVLMAIAGAGPWSLVFLQLTRTGILAGLAWIILPWRPGPPRRGCGIRSFVSFGANVTGSNLVHAGAQAIDKVLLGKYVGAADVGLYGKANMLTKSVLVSLLTPIGSVATAAMCRLNTRSQDYRRFYLQAVKLLTFVLTPLLVFLAVYSPEVVHFLLGDKWLDAIPVAAVFLGTATILPICFTNSWLYLSAGRAAPMMRWCALDSMVTILAIIAGLPSGIMGVALAIAAVRALLMFPGLWYATRGTSVTVVSVVAAVWTTFAGSAAMCAAIVGFRHVLLGHLPRVLLFAAGLPVAIVIYLLAVCLFARSAEPLRNAVKAYRLLRDSLGRRTARSESP